MKLKLTLLLALVVLATCHDDENTNHEHPPVVGQKVDAKNEETTETVTRPPVPKVDLTNGFGGSVDWVTYEEALKLNKDPKDNRPVFVLVYGAGCGACKSKFNY